MYWRPLHPGAAFHFAKIYSVEKTYNLSPKKINIAKDKSKVKSEYFDIIMRDRVLRNEPWDFSVALLKQYESNISALFESYDVQFVFSATVDQFAIDMVYRHCLKLKIPFIGYHMSVIPGYTLLSIDIHPYPWLISIDIHG